MKCNSTIMNMRNQMVMEERREHRRLNIENLAAFVCVDENFSQLDQGMGRALDISLGGISLETYIPIESPYILLSISGVKNELQIDIKGKVVHCKGRESGIFQTGIQFLETSERIKEIVINMIKVFNLQK